MKPTKLNSAREVMEALLRGEKIHKRVSQSYFSLSEDGKLMCNSLAESHDATLASLNYAEWEIYREPPKKCGFSDAIEKMRKGHSMRRPHWIKGACFRWRPDTDEIVTAGECNWAMFHMDDFIAQDWLPVEGDEG